MVVGAANGQAFNIDLDVFGGTEGIGNGAPSSQFGAAAGQTGLWNRFFFGIGPHHMQDTAGQMTEATMTLLPVGGVPAAGSSSKAILATTHVS